MPLGSSPFDDLASIPGLGGDAAREQLAASPLPLEMPDDTDRRLTTEALVQQRVQNNLLAQQGQQNRMKAGDFARRSVAFKTTPDGTVTPIADASGAPITDYNKAANVGFDGAGNPVQIRYGVDGPPKVEDAFAGLLPETDRKTGDQYLKRRGLPWQWTGQDPDVVAKNLEAEKEKAVGQASQAMGRKLSIEERQLHRDEVEYKARAKAFQKAHGLTGEEDHDTARQQIEANFDAEYATPDANRTTGWFSDQYDPAAEKMRADIGDRKAKALQEFDALIPAGETIAQRRQQVAAQQAQRDQIETARANAALQRAGKVLGLPATQPESQPGDQLPQEPTAALGPNTGATGQSNSSSTQPAGQPPSSQHLEAASRGQKPYRYDQENGVQFTPDKLVEGLDQGVSDGVVDPDWAKANRDKFQEVQTKYAELQKAAGNNQVLKALLHGGGKGAAFIAGSIPGAKAGAALGAIIPGIGETGISEGIGAVLGGLTTGTLASLATGKALDKLGEYSDAVKSLNASAELHPVADATGELVAFASSAPKAIMNLGKLGAIAKAGAIGEGATEGVAKLAAAKTIGGVLAKGAAGGAVFEGAVRPAFDAARYAVADQLDIEHEDIQKPGVQSIATNVALGILTAGHSIQFRDYTSADIASILTRAKVRNDAGIPLDKDAPMGDIVDAFREKGVDLTSDAAHSMARPLTKEEIALHGALAKQTKAMEEAGDFKDAAPSFDAAQQAVIPTLKRGEGKQITSATIRAEPVERPSGEPSVARLENTTEAAPAVEPESPSARQTPAEAPSPTPPDLQESTAAKLPSEDASPAQAVESVGSSENPASTPAELQQQKGEFERQLGLAARAGDQINAAWYKAEIAKIDEQLSQAPKSEAKIGPLAGGLSVKNASERSVDREIEPVFGESEDGYVDLHSKSGNEFYALPRAGLGINRARFNAGGFSHLFDGEIDYSKEEVPRVIEPAVIRKTSAGIQVVKKGRLASTAPARPAVESAPAQPIVSTEAAPVGDSTAPSQAKSTSRKGEGIEQTSTVDTAAHEAATSPQNDKVATQKQLDTGNAEVGRVNIDGLNISIEHPAGTSRKPGWKPLEGAHYGRIRGTVAGDGEAIDTFIKEGTPKDYSGPVYVINRHPAGKRGVDFKAVIGADSAEDALAIHNRNYPETLSAQPEDVATFSSTKSFKDWATGASRRTAPAKGDVPSNRITIPGIEEELTPETKAQEAPANPSESKAVPQGLRGTAGWKLHLTVSQSNLEAVSAKLSKLGLRHKVGRSGEQEGKDITVYAGSRSSAESAAASIERAVGGLIGSPIGDALKDDTSFSKNVMGRFDPAGDAEFHQYGSDGIPYLNDDVHDQTFGGAKKTPKELRDRANALLQQRYGEFYGEAKPASSHEITELQGKIEEIRSELQAARDYFKSERDSMGEDEADDAQAEIASLTRTEKALSQKLTQLQNETRPAPPQSEAQPSAAPESARAKAPQGPVEEGAVPVSEDAGNRAAESARRRIEAKFREELADSGAVINIGEHAGGHQGGDPAVYLDARTRELHLDPERMRIWSEFVESTGADVNAWETAVAAEEKDHYRSSVASGEDFGPKQETIIQSARASGLEIETALKESYYGSASGDFPSDAVAGMELEARLAAVRDGRKIPEQFVPHTKEAGDRLVELLNQWDLPKWLQAHLVLMGRVKEGRVQPETPAVIPNLPAVKPAPKPKANKERGPPVAPEVPAAETKPANPLETLNRAAGLKLTVPKGATFLRVTPTKGQVIIQSVKNVGTGANVLQGAGPYRKIEAGTIGRKNEFLPLAGEVGVEERVKAGAPEPSSEYESVLQHTVEVAKREIEEDIATGAIPANVTTFSQLNDHVDANMYVSDRDREDRRIGPLGKKNGWKGDDYINFTNDAIERIEQWLKAGRPRDPMVPRHVSNGSIVGPGLIDIAGASNPIVAHHASPYKVDKLKLSKAYDRSGEGSGAFGYGIYVAESEAVSGVGGNYYESFKRLTGSANSYRVEIDAEPEHVLDYDKPLSKQSQFVQDALEKMGIKPLADDPTGSAIYARVPGTPEQASAKLREAGIPAMRYLDEHSRHQGDTTALRKSIEESKANLAALETSDASETQKEFLRRSLPKVIAREEARLADKESKPATSNFVVFDDSKIKITHENGQPVDDSVRRNIVGASDPRKAAKPDPEAQRAEKIQTAYRNLTVKTGFPAVSIGHLAQEVRMPTGELQEHLRNQWKQGNVVFSSGDWSLSDAETKGAAMQVAGQRVLQVRFLPQTRAGAPNPVKVAHDAIANEVAAARDAVKNAPLVDRIKSGSDAVGTYANELGEQQGNSIRLDYEQPRQHGETRQQRIAREQRNKRDGQAARFVVEQGGDLARLNEERDKILASPNAKLKAKFLPLVDHAIANATDLSNKSTNHRSLTGDIFDALTAAGEDFGFRNDFVHRVTRPGEETGINQLFSMGSGQGTNPKGMEKSRVFDTIGDAVKAGFDPGDYTIWQADQAMVEKAWKIIGAKAFLNEMRATVSPVDGLPIIGKLEPVKKANGTTDLQKPRGYSFVQAGGQQVIVHDSFAGLFRDLYGTSALRSNALWRGILKAEALAKHGTLVLDTFHVGRLLFKMAAGGGGGPLTTRNGKLAFNFRHGLALLEYSDADLGRAESAGEITAKEAGYARANRQRMQKLISHGLNIGKVADNLLDQAQTHLPFISTVNDWIFRKLSRGAMAQTALKFLDRNLANKRLTPDEAYRQTAKEMNEYFGNLQNQGIFTSKTLQDVARVVFLAPNWTESQFRYEGRAYAQGIKSAVNGVRGKGFTVGNSARAFAVGFAALLAVNQFINYLTRKHSTFENPEEGHKLDAWIPGAKRGFWFNPFEIAGEYAHAFHKYTSQNEHAVDAAAHIASNKLSPLARGVKEAVSGRDALGRHFLNNTDRFRSSLADALPSPLPLGAALEKDPRQPLGYRLTRQPAAIEKQLLQSIGAKVTAAQSPRTQMFALASDFRADRGKVDAAGEYTELRRALDSDNDSAAKSEIQWLQQRGKSTEQIGHAMGIKKDGTIAPERFTGGEDRESEMLKSLNAEQKAVYRQAQKDHVANARRFQAIARTMPRQNVTIKSSSKPIFTGFN